MKKSKSPIIEDDEETEKLPPSLLLTSLFEEKENDRIIILDTEINSISMHKASKKLINLHMDESFTDEIQVIINSPGGYTNSGWAFIDLMAWCKNPIRTIALGEIASMAVDIFIAGDKRIVSPNCLAMIHQFSGGFQGTYDDLIATKKGWDLETKKHIRHLIKYSKYKTEKKVKENLLDNSDTWLSPNELLKHGLCDEVFKPKNKKK